MAERKNNSDLNARRKHSKHIFRYVIGEVVSSVWLNTYLQSDKKQQKIMEKRFVNYLGKTDKANLENICELALGKGNTLNSTITNYLNFITKEEFSL